MNSAVQALAIPHWTDASRIDHHGVNVSADWMLLLAGKVTARAARTTGYGLGDDEKLSSFNDGLFGVVGAAMQL